MTDWRVGTVRKVDAHLHLWDLQVSDYAWLSRADGALQKTFTPSQARAELDGAGIDAAILVQAEDSERDTEFMLATASANPWIAGVIGWVRLDDPSEAERALDRWQEHPAFCGVRHLVHEDPRDDFLALPTVRRSLALLAERGVAFDVPNAWPRHLAATAILASELPELTIVLDHLAKPPVGQPDFSRWYEEIGRVAAHPNTVGKVSGLLPSGVSHTTDQLRPVWEHALDVFGPSRLMYGGDWPMTIVSGGYQRTWNIIRELVAELSSAEQDLVFGGTALAVYGATEHPIFNRDETVIK